MGTITRNSLLQNKLLWAIATFGLLLYLPAFLYAIKTGPALIDDYADAGYLTIFSSLDNFRSFVSHNMNYHIGGRWRPFYEFEVGLRWTLWGDTYSLHKTYRMAMRVAVSFFSAGLAPLLLRKSRHALLIQIGLFFTLLLFPNNPEARLAPQELPLVLFLSIFYYGVISCYVCEPNDKTDGIVRQIFWIIIPALGMVSSKEPGFILVPPAIVTILLAKRPRTRRYLLSSILMVITGWCYVRLSRESSHLGSIFELGTIGTFMSYVFNPFRSRVWMVIFCVLFVFSIVVMLRRALVLGYYSDKFTRVFFLMFTGWLLYSYLILFIPNLCLRYSFPVSWFTLILVTLPICCANENWGNKLLGRAIFSLWAILTLLMYQNYLFQFYSQYRFRKAEQSLVAAIDQIQRGGGVVWMENADEMSNSLNIAFCTDFSDRFALKRTPLKSIDAKNHPPPGSYVVNPTNSDGNDLEAYLPKETPVSTFYKAVDSLHTILSLGSAQAPLVDCGSPQGVGDVYGRIIKLGAKS